MSINLEFLSNEAHEDEGLGNAGIETYREDPYAGAARETGQNSRDAATALPVRITFDVLEVPFADVPDIGSLRDAVAACLSKAIAANNEKECAFFEQAQRVLTNGPLKILRISDSNTTGLRGPNVSGTPFHSLVKGSGVASIGSPPSLASLRYSWAFILASAKETRRRPPRPMSRRVPCTTVRSTQRFAPDGSTTRYNPLPSPYRPGTEMLFTRTDVRAFWGCLRRESIPQSIPQKFLDLVGPNGIGPDYSVS